MAEYPNLLSIPIRAVLYREGGRWLAHCLEFDLIGDGATHEDALESLKQAIEFQVDEVVEHGKLDNLFSPAEGKYLQIFAAGRNVAATTIHFQVKLPVEIERFEAREYLASAN